MASILPNGKNQFVDSNGRPLARGKVYFYEPNTETFKDTYTDDSAGTPNTNPITLDGAGRASIWGIGFYRQVVVDWKGNLIWDTVVSEVGAAVDQLRSDLAAANGSQLIGFKQAGVDAVTRTVDAKLREISVSLEDYGGGTTATPAQNSIAFERAHAALVPIGGGWIDLGPGVYSFGNRGPGVVSGSGTTSWDNRYCCRVTANNIKLRGKGIGATVLKLGNGENAHVIQFGQRVGSTIMVSDGAVIELSIDGNRANQVAPDATNNHFDGVNIATGCSRIALRRLFISEAQFYGIGVQRDNFTGILIEDVWTNNTGADGIDFKGDSDSNIGNVLRNFHASNWGLTNAEADFAGADLRSGIAAEDIFVDQPGSANAMHAIRLQLGTPGATPAQATTLSSFRGKGSGIAGSSGLRVLTRFAEVNFGRVATFDDGVSCTEPDARISDIVSEANITAGYRFWVNSGTGGKASTNALLGLVGRNNGVAGAICDNVSELTFSACDMRNNGGLGWDIRPGCSNIRVLGGSSAGNGSPVSAAAGFNDQGSGTIIRDVSGYRTINTIIVAGIDISSTGPKAITAAHGLPFTPKPEDVRFTLMRDSNVGDWAANEPWVVSCDGTNVNAQMIVTKASATASQVVKVVVTVESKNR